MSVLRRSPKFSFVINTCGFHSYPTFFFILLCKIDPNAAIINPTTHADNGVVKSDTDPLLIIMYPKPPMKRNMPISEITPAGLSIPLTIGLFSSACEMKLIRQFRLLDQS